MFGTAIARAMNAQLSCGASVFLMLISMLGAITPLIPLKNSKLAATTCGKNFIAEILECF
jgi:hypothetical protein